ncbi:MAG TPA: flagellar assembly peptidoglycan hydrolase FlgJ [Steroidobacteraceae bacterium]|jgi:flagellar protein FlgJ|nr:flagellar assembly peptidoglycan hydrolase FlgJ [Steroidobacteraceae bacterium]
MSISPLATDASAAAANAETYTDFSGLKALKLAAAKNDPSAVRKVAQQFEAMFTRMMLKSMRDAVGTDPIFGSEEEKTYQGMYDDQLSLQLSKGRGLGLADMLVKQLQRLSGAAAGAGAASNPPTPAPSVTSGSAPSPTGKSTLPAASTATQQNFIQGLWPQAQQAGQQLGVAPSNLIAQAALETNWGRNLPHDGTGHTSNNLFGVKATGSWEGASVQAQTTEVTAQGSSSELAPFRSYADATQSFQDYVSILRNNPRYAAALNTGADARAFATGLQRGGYATDPDYARKVSAVASNISGHLAMTLRGLTGLKSGADVPTTVTTSTL